MAYTITTDVASFQQIADTSTVQNHKLGTIVTAEDPTYGGGEFIYLKGVASTVVGSWVTWGSASGGVPSYQTVLAPTTANLGVPVAVAMSANVANQYGWYQISGHAVAANNGTQAADTAVFTQAAGVVFSTATAGRQVLNCRAITATGTPATNQSVYQINRPFLQGQIT